MRLWQLIAVFTLVMLLPFVIWGDTLEQHLSFAALIEWIKREPVWAVLAGVLLLTADLVLPVPGTVIMSALGYALGPWWGGLASVTGSMLSGTIGYLLCYRYGRTAATRLCPADDLARAEGFFSRHGVIMIALSRWLPLWPEIAACLAGVSQMPSRLFFTGLTLGSVPMGFIYAFLGASGKDHPTLALALSAGLPAVLVLVSWLLKRRSAAPPTSLH
jgi:uncharacterized membrane protein YdjX (TVP38/TMEM64 family)